MANIHVTFTFDDGEISELNAFKVYQAHIKTEKHQSYQQILGVTYLVTTYSGEEYDPEPEWVKIELWNPEINVIEA